MPSLNKVNKEVDRVVIGRFGRTHGVKGFITIHSFTVPRDNILSYTQWHALIDKRWQPINALRVNSTDKHILALIEGFADRDQAARLTNVDIAVSRDQLPELEPGDYYWHELTGMTVVNRQGFQFGIVSDIMPTGSNDVLVVEGDKRYLIPYLPGRFVIQVDKEGRRITVDWDTEFL
ncbi:16S rRNA-processing protein RimM [Legionella spiritensis]|uniref:Ribosome maturation factor RimM n=1 Tax=Legionella spiritensis TaxID=452 RepID=A0A0W0Z0U7_LEGSP|nr:16S rRNA-processing protein RimM [Legionella spiritensis]SNV30812.1 16S rRNA-processing protein RimM [Legionella spiritensis]